MRKTYIYTLSDPRTPDVIRYVGKTVQPRQRYRQHVWGDSGQSRLVVNWIKSLTKVNLKPLMTIISVVYHSDTDHMGWVNAETYWISYYRTLNHSLCNHTSGGEGTIGYLHTAETKQKLRDNRVGCIVSQETREKQSKSRKGRCKTEEHKEKLRAARKGVARPKEVMDRIHKTKREKYATEILDANGVMIKLMTTVELSRKYNRALRWIQALAKCGKLPAIQNIKGHYHILEKDFVKFFNLDLLPEIEHSTFNPDN